jgi:DNA-binding transcriptional ArsR family regulator
VLREYHFVRAERKGRRRMYGLYDDHIAALVDDAVRLVEELQAARSRRASA